MQSKFQLRLLAALVGAALAGGAQAQLQGPSSSQTAYVTPTAAGWKSMSIISAGDSVPLTGGGGSYRMAGTPDGLGAYDNGDGTFTVLMNHEFGSTAGVARAHGATGAFVSEWIIRKSDFTVLSGRDLAASHLVSTGVDGSGNTLWGAATGAANSFNRLCSADLPLASAFYNAASGLGTQQRIFMNGEEAGNEGRAYGFVATTVSGGSPARVAYELPKLGKFSWENSVANPFSGDKTVVVGLDDSTPGQVYVYTGMKTNTGNAVQMAGLDNGTLRGIKVNAPAAQGGTTGNREAGPINGAFSTVAIDTSVNGAAQQAASAAAGVTEFARPEDGHWADARTFYFVTTGANAGAGTQTARLYKLTFAQGAGGAIDYDNGSIAMVLDSASLTGTDGQGARSFDNITVDETGRVLIQEDPGNNAYIAKTWVFDPATGRVTQILESDRARFLTPTAPYTQDEESSGVIDITSILGRNDGSRYYLADMQAHYGISGEIVEGGQLYVVAVPEAGTIGMMLAGLGAVGFVARRRRPAR